MSLHGHRDQVAAFLDARVSGRLHHAWLLAGPRGIGKGLFARNAALRLLADEAGPSITAPGLETPDEHPIARLWAAGSHPDAMILERLWREKTKDHARQISIEQVRSLSRLFATGASFSPWRVVIVDTADDLAREGANALLKLLEEPPANSLFFLISHAPGRLLPTIRSRCRMLRFEPLGGADMAAALGEALPDADERERGELVALGAGSPGRAMGFAGLDVGGLDAAMEAIIRTGDPHNGGRGALARSLALKAAQPRYELLLDRLPSRIAAEARGRQGRALADALALWEKARDLAGKARPLSLDPQATVFELGGLLAALNGIVSAAR